MRIQKIKDLNSGSDFSILYKISLRLEKAYNIGSNIRNNSELDDIQLKIDLDNISINLKHINNLLFDFEKNYLIQDFNDIILGKHYLN